MTYETQLTQIGQAADAEIASLTATIATQTANLAAKDVTIAQLNATVTDLRAQLAAAGGGGVVTPPTPTPTGNKLSWNPNVVAPLTNPTTVTVGSNGSLPTLDNAKDYIIKIPAGGVTGPITINGGRNFHLIGGVLGGRKTKPALNSSYDSPNRGIRIGDGADSRKIFIEGLLGEAGTYFSDFIQFAIRSNNNVTAYVQNCRVEGINWGTNTGSPNVHADAIQLWGGPVNLFVDSFVALNCTYQGFYWDNADGRAAPSGAKQPWIVRRVFLQGSSAANGTKYLLANRRPSATNIVNDRVFTFGQGQNATDSFGQWPAAGLTQSAKPATDFAPLSQWAGGVYVSPGYV